MKDAQGSVSTTTNMSSNAQEMTIHAGAIGKLMSMFSNQYSDGPLAVVREYFCNGDDARISVGSDRPTEVFLPTDLNPEILIRDFGPGLDREGLTTVFSTYGLSTKDQSNDETGGFGIGSKAAFTIGQQFTVTGFKDGVKTVVLFALNDRGIGEHDVRFEGPTTEPNGVLVSVGVPDVAAMRRAAERFFLTVPQGRALVDGQPPKHLSEVHEFVRFNDEVMLVKDGNGEIRLQMGPVTYRVSKSILQAVHARLDGLDSQRVAKSLVEWDQTNSLLMEVPMGAVNIAPSREDLRDTDATVGRIADIVQGIHDYIVSDVQRQIDAQPTLWKAMCTLSDALESLKGFKVSRKAFSFAGQDAVFKKEVKVEAPTLFMAEGWTGRSWKTSVALEKDHTVDASRMDKTLVIAGVLAADVPKVKRYAKRFFEENAQGYKWIVITEEFSGAVDWFEWGIEGGVTTWSLDDYRAALRSMRDSNPRTANEPSYTTGWRTTAERDLDMRDLLTDIINEGKDIVIFFDQSRVSSEMSDLLDEKYSPVVLLPQQSENALRKRVEADGSVAIADTQQVLAEARALVTAAVKAEVPEPTTDERIALGAAEWVKEQRGYWKRDKMWSEALVEAFGGFPTPIQHPVISEMEDAMELAVLLAADLTEERQADLARLRKWADVEFEAIEYAAEFTEISKVFPLLVDNYGNGNYERIRKNPDYRRDALAYINSLA